MMTKDVTGHTCLAVNAQAPPPLHVYSAVCEQARWYPLARPVLGPQPGPQIVSVPQPPGSLYGDDPTDPTAQTYPRKATVGMVGRLNLTGQPNVAASGVRR